MSYHPEPDDEACEFWIASLLIVVVFLAIL